MFAAITGHNNIETILRGIDKALALDVKVKINAVLMKQYNEQELQNFLTCLKAISVALRLIELMQTGDKEATHWLQDGYTGSTKHLAMLDS